MTQIEGQTIFALSHSVAANKWFCYRIVVGSSIWQTMPVDPTVVTSSAQCITSFVQVRAACQLWDIV